MPRRAGFVGLLAFAAASAHGQAVVLETTGEPAVIVGPAAAPVAMLQVLLPTMQLRLPGRSRVVLLMMRTGQQLVLDGPSEVIVESSQLRPVSGSQPQPRVIAEGRSLPLRTEGLSLGGIVLRSAPSPQPNRSPQPARAASAPTPDSLKPELERLRPMPGAPFAQRVAYALWLDDQGAYAEARSAWQALAAERPEDPTLAARAR